MAKTFIEALNEAVVANGGRMLKVIESAEDAAAFLAWAEEQRARVLAAQEDGLANGKQVYDWINRQIQIETRRLSE